MANFTYINLDVTAPGSPTFTILGGANYATTQLVDTTIGTTDTDKTGYQMKIWGTVDPAFDTNIQTTEGASTWIAFNNSKQIKLSAGDGLKTVNVKIRDDVYNETAAVSDSINLDTSVPTVSQTAADVPKIGTVAGKNVAAFSFTSDKPFVEYKTKVVTATTSNDSSGTALPTAGGSTNVSGTAGNYTAGTPITVTINGSDLLTATGGDLPQQKIIKVFVKDQSGKWSL